MTDATEIHLTEHDLSLLPSKREHVRFYRVPGAQSDNRGMYGRSGLLPGIRLALPENWRCECTHNEFGYTWAVIVQVPDGKFPKAWRHPQAEVIKAVAEYMDELRPALG